MKNQTKSLEQIIHENTLLDLALFARYYVPTIDDSEVIEIKTKVDTDGNLIVV